MEAIDGLLEEPYGRAKLLSATLEQAERMGTANRLLIDLADSVANLKRLIEMCQNYVGGRYSIIVTKQYDAAQYDEP
jgi:hypothetical protein